MSRRAARTAHVQRFLAEQVARAQAQLHATEDQIKTLRENGFAPNRNGANQGFLRKVN